jgi:hypothetical protein
MIQFSYLTGCPGHEVERFPFGALLRTQGKTRLPGNGLWMCSGRAAHRSPIFFADISHNRTRERRMVDLKADIPSDPHRREVIRKYAFGLSCEDQYWLASVIAENIGYFLESEIRPPSMEDRIARLEEAMRETNPGLAI